ncbi:hypothetical protein AB0M43_37800 [Longispora sp. NPDC051575]|uniref:hypothetical protein n=1 Tax=Longispora sp. NPDC051575 TaxID=3154943 RepID=UPI0034262308
MGYRAAFIDESWDDRRGGLYLMAGVLMDSETIPEADAAVRAAVGNWVPHATSLHHQGHDHVIASMLDTVEAHAGWTTVVVQAPLRGDLESARQATLARMLTHLSEQRVHDVLLDTRASAAEWRQVQAEGRKVPDIDRRDLKTYQRLVRAGNVSHRMRLVHVNDQAHPGVWLADTVVWAARRAVLNSDVTWWDRVSDLTTVLDASTGAEVYIERPPEPDRTAPPVGERGPHDPGHDAEALLSPPAYRAEPGPTTDNPRTQVLRHLLDQIRSARAGEPAPAAAGALIEHVGRLTAAIDRLDSTVTRLLASGTEPTDVAPSVMDADDDGPDPGPETDVEID